MMTDALGRRSARLGVQGQVPKYECACRRRKQAQRPPGARILESLSELAQEGILLAWQSGLAPLIHDSV